MGKEAEQLRRTRPFLERPVGKGPRKTSALGTVLRASSPWAPSSPNRLSRGERRVPRPARGTVQGTSGGPPPGGVKFPEAAARLIARDRIRPQIEQEGGGAADSHRGSPGTAYS